MSLNLCCASSSNQFLFQLLSFIFGHVCLHHLGGALHKLLGLHIHNTQPRLTPTTPAALSTNFLACTYTTPSQHLHQQHLQHSPQTSWPAHTQHPANTYTNNNTCSTLHKLLGLHIHNTQSRLTPTTPANSQNHCREVSVKLDHTNCSYLNPGTQIQQPA